MTTTPQVPGGMFLTQPVTIDLCAAAREARLDGPVGVLWKEPNPGEFWRHFKGGIYRIVALATDELTGEQVAIYTRNARTWSRPLADFLGNVSRDGYEGPRFVPAEVPHQRELEALRRVVRAFASGRIGKTVDPVHGTLRHWWGACGYVHGATLPAVLKNLADDSVDDADRAEHHEEMVAVESALKDTSDGQ